MQKSHERNSVRKLFNRSRFFFLAIEEQSTAIDQFFFTELGPCLHAMTLRVALQSVNHQFRCKYYTPVNYVHQNTCSKMPGLHGCSQGEAGRGAMASS